MGADKKHYILILLLIVTGTLLFCQVVMDDAYIPFRYGYNLVHYGVWNFYPDKPPVEAYTTFLYTVLSIVPAALHIHPYFIYKPVGLLLFCLVVLKLYKSSASKYNSLFAILILAANWETYVHTYSGLETMLWVWLFLQIIFLVEKEVSSRQQIYLWILCLLLPLTRPEGIIISVFVFCYLQFIRKIKINYGALFICALIGIAYFMIRYRYFGLLFPLPFYQKSIKSNNGIVNLAINTFTSFHYLSCIILCAIILRKHMLFRWLSTLTLIIFFGVYSTSLLTMNFADRFSYQLFFPLMLYGLLSAPALQQKMVRYISILLIAFIYFKGVYFPRGPVFSSLKDNLLSGYYYSRTHLNLALHFRKLNHPEIKVFCNEAGVFPYYSGIDYYDPEGLTDQYLSGKQVSAEYIQQVNPDVFLYLVLIPKEKINQWINGLPLQHPLAYYKFLLNSDQYTKIGYVTCKENSAYIGIAINKQSAYYEEICAIGRNAILQADSNTFAWHDFIHFKYSRSFPVL